MINDNFGANDKIELAVSRGRELSEGIKVTGHVKYRRLKHHLLDTFI